MSDFERWWILLSKVPYMDKEEVARAAWNASMQKQQSTTTELIDKLSNEVNEHIATITELEGKLEKAEDSINDIKETASVAQDWCFAYPKRILAKIEKRSMEALKQLKE